MSSRQLKRGENIVNLTQTEIMLVLTIVVLVLLLAGEIDLKAYQKKIFSLQEQMLESPANAEEMRKHIDRNKEIKGELVRSGMASSNQGNPMLTEKDVQTLKNVIKESPAKGEELRQLQDALEEKNKVIDKMRLANRENKRKEEAGSGDKYGYTPCWPRIARQGIRTRYHAYDVTHDKGLFRITQSSDWSKPRVPKLGEKLDQNLSLVLRAYPRKAVSKEDFAEFGERVESVLAGMRGNDLDGWYEPGCSLVVTLNPEAPGSIAAFIRESVGMYPITRNRR